MTRVTVFLTMRVPGGYSRPTVPTFAGPAAWRPGMKCPRCQQENPAHAKSCLECGAPVNEAAPRSYAELKDEIQGLRHRLTEASEQKTATSEILQVISRSPTDTQPVFDTIAINAARLCAAKCSAVALLDGDWLTFVGQYNFPADAPSRMPLSEAPNSERVIREGTIFHVADTENDARITPAALRLLRLLGARAVLNVPMKRGDLPVGSIYVYRAQPGGFANDHIELLETFAHQAVIAIANVRLFNETKEALDQQTATSEILRVISTSPTDAQPVFEAIAQSAMRLCDATMSVVSRYDGELIHLAAYSHVSAAAVELMRQRFPMPPRRVNVHGRVVLEAGVVHVLDLQADAEYDPAVGPAFQNRSVLGVPMLLEGRVLGAIAVARPEVRPFSDAQIALLKTFGDQAVIAIENVRLFNETKEALERQTATSGILRVISSSPTDVQPVFDTIAESAVRLCDAAFGAVVRFDGEWITIAALSGLRPDEREAVLRYFPTRPSPDGPALSRVVLKGEAVHIQDVQVDPKWRAASAGPAFSAVEGFRTFLAVPLIREGLCLGAVNVWRREVSPFSEQHIALLKTFADQAVIAIENVRLFTELREKNRALTEAHAQVSEALQHQTATSEILQVISRSPTDVQPVFDTIIRSAVRLLGGYSGLVTRIIGDHVHLAALTSTNPSGDAAQKALWPRPVKEDVSVHGQVITSLVPSFITDVESDRSVPPSEVAVARARGWRSIVAVPLLRDGRAIGSLAVTRSAPGAFADGQVALLQTFANQAVIAIENVRLFTELEAGNHDLTRALDRETATSEILRVISSSPTDVQPVFDAIVGAIYRRDGGLVSLVGLDPRYPHAEEVRAAYPAPVTSTLISCRAIHENAIMQLPDTETPGVLPAEGLRLARLSGFRSVVAVPMRREGEPIGAILVGRPAVGAFPDEQIGLLQTFADQAVIAIENARLFTELQRKNLALTEAHAQVSEALDQQTATAEILRVISRAQTDVQPVFEAIADTAMRLLGAWAVAVGQYDGELLSMAAARGGLPGSADAATDRFQRPHRPAFAPEEAVLTKRVHHVADIETDPSCSVEFRRHAAERGSRSFVAVPMLRGGDPIGLITVSRAKPGAFSTAEIALLQTFADQAVIAIENVRLFTELQEKNRALTQAHAKVTESLEQQTATSEILSIIARTPTDVQPVFDAIAASAARLCQAYDAAVFRLDGDSLRLVAHHGPIPSITVLAVVRGTVGGRAVLERQPVHVTDVQAEGEAFPEASAAARHLGFRTILAVPLLREGQAIGILQLRRTEGAAFTDQQVQLLQTFADQAVIAIENVRLFNELEARNRDLMATSEILQAISRSPTDVQPVFDTIAERAMRLCSASYGAVFMFDGELIQLSALANVRPEGVDALRKAYPQAPSRRSNSGRVMLTGDVVEIPDVLADPEYQLTGQAAAVDFRSTLGVPMLHQGRAIGVIVVSRQEPGAFAGEQIQLLKTFADQAVIAIENVRLFKELQEKNRSLTEAHAQVSEALERQTATADILRVISQSQAEVQPVFDAIVNNAMRLFRSWATGILRLDGQLLHLIAV